MKNKKMKKLLRQLLILVIISILLFSIVNAFSFYYDDSKEALEAAAYIDPRIPGWYDVSEWELSVCSAWGGYSKAEDITASAGELNENVGGLTLSIQAYKSPYLNPQDLTGNYTLYEVSWLFIPADEQVEYKLMLKGKSVKDFTSVRGADPVAGDSGYESLVLKEDFNFASLMVKGKSTSLIDVPIVDKVVE